MLICFKGAWHLDNAHEQGTCGRKQMVYVDTCVYPLSSREIVLLLNGQKG